MVKITPKELTRYQRAKPKPDEGDLEAHGLHVHCPHYPFQTTRAGKILALHSIVAGV